MQILLLIHLCHFLPQLPTCLQSLPIIHSSFLFHRLPLQTHAAVLCSIKDAIDYKMCHYCLCVIHKQTTAHCHLSSSKISITRFGDVEVWKHVCLRIKEIQDGSCYQVIFRWSRCALQCGTWGWKSIPREFWPSLTMVATAKNFPSLWVGPLVWWVGFWYLCVCTCRGVVYKDVSFHPEDNDTILP